MTQGTRLHEIARSVDNLQENKCIKATQQKDKRCEVLPQNPFSAQNSGFKQELCSIPANNMRRHLSEAELQN